MRALPANGDPMQKVQITINCDASVAFRVERAAALMSRPGVDVTRAAVARAALERGLALIEADVHEPSKRVADFREAK